MTPPAILAAMRHYDATGDGRPLAAAVRAYWRARAVRLRLRRPRATP